MTGMDLIDMAGQFCEASLLHHSVDMGLFEHTRQPCSTEELAEALGVRPEKLGPILDGLVAIELLSYRAGTWLNTQLTSRHLVAGAPDDLRAYILHLKEQSEHWLDLEAVLSASTPFPWQQDLAVFERPASHEQFLIAMSQEVGESPDWVAALPEWSHLTRVLDLGGGHGRFATAIVARHAGLQAEVWDVPQSEACARSTIRQAGLEGRVGFRACDLREPGALLAETVDGILMANLIGNFSPPRIESLILEAASALRPGGALVIFGSWLDDDRVSPASSAIVGLHMAVGCANGWLPPDGFVLSAMMRAGLTVRVERYGDEEAAWIGHTANKGFQGGRQ